MLMNHFIANVIRFSAVVFLAVLASQSNAGEPAKSKFAVKIQDEKTLVVDMEHSGAIDPMQRINFQPQGSFYASITTMNKQMLHLSHFPQFQINGRTVQPGFGGRFEAMNAQLPNGPGNKKRTGYMNVWLSDGLRITQSVELHPSRAKGPGQKRLLNTMLIAYTVENTTKEAQTVAVRVCMDTYVVTNDGCLFASPVTHPGKILDGIVLKDKTLPPYLQMLQVPNLQNPGYVSHLTLNVGGRYEKADKLVLSSLRAGFGNWEMNAIPAGFDSAISFYWPSKELKPGAKRDMAYAYGEDIAVPAESEGRFQFDLGGSFEPGKIFTISATVADPGLGQTLTLELPKGMERLEGKEVQPVAPLGETQDYSTVLWKARVLEPGQHAIRIRSSSGVAQTKVVTVTAAK